LLDSLLQEIFSNVSSEKVCVEKIASNNQYSR